MAIEWTRLKLVVDDFDDAAVAARVAEVDMTGIQLVTMAELGVGPAERRKLYELNRECSRDVPEQGEFYSFAEYVSERLDVESFDPRFVEIALAGDEWIGMTAASNRMEVGYFFDEMTGVLREYRGRGISLAMKLDNIRRIRDFGCPLIVTTHHPQNTSAIEMNRRLGYVDR
jgi:GNAT superfamily N-acetyltransferase